MQYKRLHYCFSCISGLVLNSFIRHYEPAYFSKEHLAHQRATTNLKAQLHKSPQRRKRETHSQFYEKDHANSKNNQNIKSFRNERYHKPIMFNFTAHNRLVHLLCAISYNNKISSKLKFR